MLLKRIDTYIIRKFLPIFAAAFFICLFVFMMQFTWRFIDELIGKGLTLDIMARFFWHMALTLVPQSLPLSVLLAALITFGNMGEQLELLAMKAAGMSLVRIMMPLGLIAAACMGASFYFQNTISPNAQINLRQLLISMKLQTPVVEVPEGIFYNGVPGVNLYVERKDAETGMLYQCIIYKTDQGFERAQIVLADSGRMEMSADKMHLRLDLWSGEQFQSLKGQQAGTGQMLQGANDPYDRETFAYKELLIDFDANFQMLDRDLLTGLASTKDLQKIEHDVDSVHHHLDSLSYDYYQQVALQYFRGTRAEKALRAAVQQHPAAQQPFDSLLLNLPAAQQQQVRAAAASTAQRFASELEWKANLITEGDFYIRRHWIEWHTKWTLALACLMFFFIGAPLGAIIRKGGLGMPTVISVILFIFYYIINTSGMKMAREGSLNMIIGMWASTFILLPFGLFITVKSNRDSVVFNLEEYIKLLRRLLGLRTARHISRKDVVIHTPRHDAMRHALDDLAQACTQYRAATPLLRLPSYINIFFRSTPDDAIKPIAQQLENIVEELSNSRNNHILRHLNELPILYIHAHTAPFRRPALNIAAGLLLPVGIVLWIRIWRFRLRLHRDLTTIIRTAEALQPLLDENPKTPTL